MPGADLGTAGPVAPSLGSVSSGGGHPVRVDPAPSPERARAASWARLAELAADCTACPFHLTRTQVVLFRGSRHPRVLFVGEAPGAEEDRRGVPFVGRAGRRLDDATEALDLRPEEWAVINLVKCRPPGNRFVRRSAERCRPFLDRQIELLDPPWIVTLGRHALASLDPGAPPVTEAAGRERRLEGRRLFPLLHPAAALHDPRLRARWASDLQRLRTALSLAPETL